MPFNTAIFYDIENLLKGYSFSQQLAANLSLADILTAIRQTERPGQVAVQRAYANWSDPRLAIMRGEINELGIDPIQVFGFARDQKKNAADIQLAIDAIDLAHARPALEVFVIVSGDGGFASLAKKLHEYGKTVVGCAYRSAANKIFQAVCDDFVWITDPDEDERPAPTAAPGGPPGVTDPRNVRLAAKVRPLKSVAPEEQLAKVREVLSWYAGDATCRGDLARAGIALSTVQEGVRFAVPGFQPLGCGFAKFSEYLQYACKGSPLCVVRPANAQAALVLRTAARNGAEVLPDLDARDPQTADGYRSVLAAGAPVLQVPPAAQFRAVAEWLCRQPPERLALGAILEGLAGTPDGPIPAEAAKLGVMCLVALQAFEREPEGTPLAEQHLTLQPDVRTPERLLGLVWAAARTKLAGVLGQVRDEVLAEVLGEHPGPVAGV